MTSKSGDQRVRGEFQRQFSTALAREEFADWRFTGDQLHCATQHQRQYSQPTTPVPRPDSQGVSFVSMTNRSTFLFPPALWSQIRALPADTFDRWWGYIFCLPWKCLFNTYRECLLIGPQKCPKDAMMRSAFCGKDTIHQQPTAACNTITYYKSCLTLQNK